MIYTVLGYCGKSSASQDITEIFFWCCFIQVELHKTEKLWTVFITTVEQKTKRGIYGFKYKSKLDTDRTTCWKLSLTAAVESWSLCLDFAGIMRRIHFDPDGRHRNSLHNKEYGAQEPTLWHQTDKLSVCVSGWSEVINEIKTKLKQHIS